MALSVVVAAALSALLGLHLYVADRASALRQAEQLHRVVAVAVAPPFAADRGVRTATVDWTDAAGKHTAQATVPDSTGPGDHVVIWADRNDVPQAAPRAAAESAGTAVSYAVAAFAGAATLLAGGHAWARHTLNKRVDRSWEEEWALVEPKWNRWNHRG
ncbi:hypothetical protein [Streptacidiphilus sp. MAP12-16]|uniref:hypothetical protein n=1 Tax=Streptacidiphilus sp. MAP12-16 TaxID=3156300 RepID=UPI0035194183